MPKILELVVIDGDLWTRIGKPGDFESGVALWTPEEQKWVREDAIRAYRERILALPMDQ